jgi:hypothetical protein
MPPRPSSPPRAGRGRFPWRVACALVPGLLLGFIAGVELARAIAASSAGRPTPVPVARPAIRPLEAPQRPVALQQTDASGPTRHSVQARIDATDPAAWLAGFGEVQIAPRDAHP